MSDLAFDTCFSACSVAVRAGSGETAHERVAMETGHAEALVPMIARVMEAAGTAFADLERIVVTHGPGTFTGVRTGVAAARALAVATGAALVPVSSLWAIATAAARGPVMGPSRPACDAILAAMDARKGQLYVQVVDLAGHPLTEPLLTDAAGAAGLCPGLGLLAVGNSAPTVIDAARSIGREIGTVPASPGSRAFDQPDALALLDAADHPRSAGPLLPLYLRQPDAKPQADKSLPWSTP